ncbi:MAG: phosphoglycerate kinase [Candidatus Pacearchaeota archaeon]
MKIKTLDDIKGSLKDKRILLRIDLNSQIIENKVQNNPRFKAHSETIKLLIKKKAKLVVLAHQSNPNEKDFMSLKQHSEILNKYVKIKFVNDIIGKKALEEIKRLKNGEALLLNNVRFLSEEFDVLTKKNKLIETLFPLFDYYINDAFSIMHRNQASIVLFPKKIESFIGPVAEKELNNIEKLKSKLKKCTFILGGKKAEDVIFLINQNNILTTGILSLFVLKAKGYKLGYEDNLLKNIDLIKSINVNIKNIKYPTDLAIKLNNSRKELPIDELPVNSEILDIGSKTINSYKKEIKKAKAIFIKGAPGDLDQEGFEIGTKELLKAISKSKAFSIVSGGSLSDAIERFKIKKKLFSYVSLSGGALIYYLAKRKLPGLEALKR